MDRKQQVPMTLDELKSLPVFEQFLEAAAKEAEKLGLTGDEPSPDRGPN
jgi:pantoate kinase